MSCAHCTRTKSERDRERENKFLINNRSVFLAFFALHFVCSMQLNAADWLTEWLLLLSQFAPTWIMRIAGWMKVFFFSLNFVDSFLHSSAEHWIEIHCSCLPLTSDVWRRRARFTSWSRNTHASPRDPDSQLLYVAEANTFIDIYKFMHRQHAVAPAAV